MSAQLMIVSATIAAARDIFGIYVEPHPQLDPLKIIGDKMIEIDQNDSQEIDPAGTNLIAEITEIKMIEITKITTITGTNPGPTIGMTITRITLDQEIGVSTEITLLEMEIVEILIITIITMETAISIVSTGPPATSKIA